MFAYNLMELRKYHSLSQEELAEKIGVSRQTLSKYETGESLPDIEKCKALADVFGITEYSCAAEPPVQCSVSHLSRRSEPQ